ncbi:hypothetical protein NCS57_00283500 [Fusarium keratoplasticum]|uniref:Uncharacterized protein n=1 Tax=Fusarium keratoplasticum TaxID=1328300 RepID=A0ACC0RBM9_9HYPO|nr:hypothetical protein NCS57_00283500 [Fusarium keratoplasticum]KAI8680038.1 hypothetical protein NCS57_00283500 [Fusarium keratoplasticum]
MSRRWNHQAPDLPWIGNTAPQESRPGSPSTRPRPRPRPQNPLPPGPHPRNPLPPAYALPMRAAVPPVVPREAPTARPRSEDATPRERRAAGIRSAQDVEQAALEELEREDEELRARGIQGWSQTKRGPNGELLVRSQQQFGLENGSESPSKIRICITRMKDGKRETKTIALNDLPDVEMLSDVFTASAPHTDTIRIFRNAMGMWCRGENKQWMPEQIFPEKKEKRDEVIAPMSVSEEFLVPGEQTDVRSLTSNGHFIHHHPPPGIGLGWGDWDLYTEWQAHGRSVDKTWVPRGDWKPKVEGEFVFVADSDDPSAEIIVDRVIVRPDYRNAQRNIEGAGGHQRASSWDGPITSEGEPRDGLEEVRQPEEVMEGKEVKEVEAKEVGVEVAQARSIEVGAKEEEIKVEAIEEEEVGVEDEETSSNLSHGRCTTTTTLPAYVFASDTLGSSVAGQTTMLLYSYA